MGAHTHHFAGHGGAVGQHQRLDVRPHHREKVLDESVQESLLTLGRADGQRVAALVLRRKEHRACDGI